MTTKKRGSGLPRRIVIDRGETIDTGIWRWRLEREQPDGRWLFVASAIAQPGRQTVEQVLAYWRGMGVAPWCFTQARIVGTGADGTRVRWTSDQPEARSA